MKDFKSIKRAYDNDQMYDLSLDPYGVLWLKTKSIVRKELLNDFCKRFDILLQEKTNQKKFIELYDIFLSDIVRYEKYLDDFFVAKNKEQVKDIDRGKIVSELYKLKNFDRGGDYRNSLDKHLISRYVKVFSSYGRLVDKFDTEIHKAVQGYVLCSRYNHRSSIVIEHIFKSHHMVLSAIGQIKKVDFFINNIPFDLKVTYLPVNFIEKKRKEKGYKKELSELKSQAKQLNIPYNKKATSAQTYYEIIERMRDQNSVASNKVLSELKEIRMEILQEVIENPKELLLNLYEEQGELRFDSSNRLFLILVDTEDFDNSRKLKRNMDLLEPTIMEYLNSFSNKNINDLIIDFSYTKNQQTQTYKAISDAIFVVR